MPLARLPFWHPLSLAPVVLLPSLPCAPSPSSARELRTSRSKQVMTRATSGLPYCSSHRKRRALCIRASASPLSVHAMPVGVGSCTRIVESPW